MLGDGEGGEEGAGRQGHWTAVTGKGKALVSAGQSTSEAPSRGTEKKPSSLNHKFRNGETKNLIQRKCS